MKMITVKQIENEFGLPIEKWAGKCYQVACVAAKLIEGAVPIYGHYLGEVVESSMFHTASGGGFVQHGWVQLPTNEVLDPTRWVFEGTEPYLYHGPGEDYDEGGNSHRTLMIGDPPEFTLDEDITNITQDMLPTDAWIFVEKLLNLRDHFADEDYEPGDVTRHQLFWIANCNPRMMQGHAKDIYAMLDDLGLKGLVPIDNWGLVERSPM